MYDVCVIGLGYTGLPTAVVAAKSGLKVSGFDIDSDLVAAINSQSIEVAEPGLLEELKDQLGSGNLVVSDRAIVANVFVVCVPTPVDFERNVSKPNLNYVYSAIETIIPLLQEDVLIIIESTCPVGTTKKISKLVLDKRPDLVNFNIAYCPERILPGNALFEITQNSRIVGGVDTKSSLRAKAFYQNFVRGSIVISNAKTAEMCKIVENSFRDVNIAFANEISMIASEFDVNVSELISLANMHPRVSVLSPGVGVGGHCLPVDPWFLIDQCSTPTDIMRAARVVNKRKTEWTAVQVEALIDRFEAEEGRSPNVALLGISYKPDTEDFRESPGLEVSLILNQRRQQIFIVDPYVSKFSKLDMLSLQTAIETCDIFVILVPHKQFLSNEELKLKDRHLHSFC